MIFVNIHLKQKKSLRIKHEATFSVGIMSYRLQSLKEDK